MASSIPAFKAALLARLSAEAGLLGVQVSWGHPYPARLADELIIIGNATSAPGQRPVGLGSGDREEEYHLVLLISVAGSARIPQQALEERAFGLAATIERSMIAWQFEEAPFDGVVDWALVRSMESDGTIAESGDAREASVTITLAAVARI